MRLFGPMRSREITHSYSGNNEDEEEEEHQPDNWEIDQNGLLILPALDSTWRRDKKHRLIRELITNRYSMSTHVKI